MSEIIDISGKPIEMPEEDIEQTLRDTFSFFFVSDNGYIAPPD